ncbi:MAG TPA: protein kinase [Ktedonobacteraceae bacterium]|nr:protein kinase [Ktedonobacteraceae bacterium]
MQSNQSQDWQGRMLGRYRLLRLLGKGGMGEVWLGEDTQLRRQVAVKLLPVVHASDADYLKAFAYEARAAAALEHPHILPVHDFGEELNAPNGGVVTYLILPYMTGGSLRDRIHAAKGPMPMEEAIYYLKQAAQAIDYAHSQRVLHRDIKPANMLLQKNWLFLADFGIAKLLSSSTHRSQTYAGAGTPEYMAPEQAQGQAEAASDRYSLAMIAYQMLTGNLPFRGENVYDVLIKQLQQMPPAPSQFNPTLSPGVEQILMQGLAKQPTQRPATCTLFVEMLERAWETQTSPKKTDEDATMLAPWSRRLQQVQPPPVPFSSTPSPAAQQPPLKLPPITEVPNTPIMGTPQFAAGTPTNVNGVQQASSGGIAQGPLSGPVPHSAQGVQQGPISTVPPYPITGSSPFYQHMSTPGIPGTNWPPIGQTTGNNNNVYNTFNSAPTTVTGGTAGNFQTEVSSTERTNRIKRRNLLIGGGAAAAVIVVGGGAVLANSLLHPSSAPTVIKPTPTPPGPQKLMAGVAQLSLTGHTKTVSVAVWHPSGRYLATAAQDNSVMLWDLGSYLQKGTPHVQALAQPLRKWKFTNEIFYQDMSWSRDGQKLIVSALGTLYVIDVFGKENVQPVKYSDANQDSFLPTSYYYPSWSPSADMFATNVDLSLQLAVWDVKKTNGPINMLKFSDPNAPTNGAPQTQETGWSKDGTMLGSLTNYDKVVVWDVKTGKVLGSYDMPDRSNGKSVMVERETFYWSPADPHIFLASDTDVTMVFDVRKNTPLAMLGTDDPNALTIPKQNPTDIPWVPNVGGLAWSPSGRYIAGCYGRSAKIYIWDLQNKTPKVNKGVHIQDLAFPGPNDTVGHNETVIEVSWSPDGRYIATGSFDTTVIIWKVDRS